MNFHGVFRQILIAVALVGGWGGRSAAATIRFQPVADTTLIEIEPNNNMGGTLFVNAGTAGSAGARNRGLYRFDFSSIPPHSKIKSAAVTLEVTTEPSGGGVSSSFALHRMLRPWGEGDKNSTDVGSPGLGFPATTNEATWNTSFAFTTNGWISPGANDDFAPTVSSSTVVYGVALFPVFNSTPQLISDVQSWVDNDASNFGWLLKTEAESTGRTARRFGSREFAGIDTNSPPFVEIEFVPPPVLHDVRAAGGQFQFVFLGEANQAYTVEFRQSLATTNGWQILQTTIAQAETAEILVTDAVSTHTRFYRVVAR